MSLDELLSPNWSEIAERITPWFSSIGIFKAMGQIVSSMQYFIAPALISFFGLCLALLLIRAVMKLL